MTDLSSSKPRFESAYYDGGDTIDLVVSRKSYEFQEYDSDFVSSDYIYSGTKRTVDLVVSLLAVLFLAPLFLLIAGLIWLDGGKPVLFRQERVGQGKRNFHVLKFRTMAPDAEQQLRRWQEEKSELWFEYIASNFKLRKDPRVTRVGKVLRRFSLDELPQVFNVLAGDMSLVGPRPLLASEIPTYGPSIARYYEAKPGITGLWQIRGRSETRFGARVRFDGVYVRRASFLADLRILLQTVRVVFLRSGAF